MAKEGRRPALAQPKTDRREGERSADNSLDRPGLLADPIRSLATTLVPAMRITAIDYLHNLY